MLYRAIRKLSPAGFQNQSLVFFMLDMQQHADTFSEGKKPVNFHTIDSPQDQWLHTMCAAYPAKQFLLRMVHGCQQCYVAVANGELAGYGWVTTSPCHVSEINFTLPVESGCLYIYDCFVERVFRGQGIYQALLSKIIADYRVRSWPHGFHTAFISAEVGNAASIRGIKRVGFEEFTRTRYVHVGQFSRWYGIDSLIERMSAARSRNALSD